jgi:hypothetical protein
MENKDTKKFLKINNIVIHPTGDLQLCESPLFPVNMMKSKTQISNSLHELDDRTEVRIVKTFKETFYSW